MTLTFTPRQRVQFLHQAELAGHWYCNNQNSDERPWGGIRDSADLGRFVYEYVLHKDIARGMGVWGQSLAITNLLDLAERVASERQRFSRGAMLGAGYLASLQVLDARLPKSLGAFREHTPQTPESYPRDGVTGAFALCRLYRETKDAEWLERARMFANWWIEHGTDADGWPYITFDIAKQHGHNRQIVAAGEEASGQEYIKGDWQAGSAIFFYQLHRLTGDAALIERGFDPLIRGLVRIYEENRGKPVVDGFHGEVPISYGNDDFALVALACAYRLRRERRILDLLVERIAEQNRLMDASGSFPSLGGTFVCGINNLEFLQLAAEERLDVDLAPIEACVRRIADYGLTLQVKEGSDLRTLGGVWGQSSHDVARTWIHQRSTAYSTNFYLRLLAPTRSLSSWGW